MTFHEIVMLFLIVLLPAVIGFFGGMVWMRFVYLERLRRERSANRRLIRLLTKKENGC